MFKFLPFTFFSGIHGFALFAPYAACVVALDLGIKYARQHRSAVATQAALVNDVPADVDFEAVAV